VPAPGEIIVVCTANVCRSPMAAALLQHALAAEAGPLRNCRVVSAGVMARAGDAVTPHSVTALRKVGLDIAAHRSRPLTQAMMDGALAVLCMTESHRELIRLRAEPVPRHLYLFREFIDAAAEREIGDPFGGPAALYEAVRDEMVEAIPGLVRRLRELAG
jgi:protein-tyrosine phosphatase